MKMKIFLILAFSFFILSKTALAADYKIDIVDYPTDIMIESGWMQYFNVVVKNSGDSSLTNVSIYFDGEFPEWFESQIKQKDMLEPDDNVSFLVKISIPYNLESEAYPFILNVKSKEARSSESLDVRIFKTKTDMMLYQIQKIEVEADAIEKNATKLENLGKDITTITNVLNEIKYSLNEAKSYVNINEFDKATRLIKSVEILIKEATFDLTVAPPKESEEPTTQFQPEIIVYIAIPLVIIVIFYIIIRRRKKEPLMRPVDKIKGIVLEKGSTQSNELTEIENSKNLLEEEFKENLISKESYVELKEKYEKRILELKGEADRNKKV
jgi:hypothetical protein